MKKIEVVLDNYYPFYVAIESNCGVIKMPNLDWEALQRLNALQKQEQDFLEKLYEVQAKIKRGEIKESNDVQVNNKSRISPDVQPESGTDRGPVGASGAVDGPVDPVAA